MSNGSVEESPGTAFAAFYQALYPGRQPYGWQVRAAVDLAEGRVFDRLEAPTGAGKTTLIECFLFALGWQGYDSKARLPRRLFWVIDRRAVVDQVYEHVESIADQINDSNSSEPIRRVARGLAPEGRDAQVPRAVQTRLWRGGIERDAESLALDSPAIVCSTVDQVGSRMLFRGYGTSRRSRPIEAAMTGTDSLIVLDEAHISGPFLSTARAVANAQASAEVQVTNPARVISVSATLESGDGSDFRLNQEELREPALDRRLRTRKWATLVHARNRVRGLVSEANRLAKRGARIVGVIANTVQEARAVHAELSASQQAVLVIGPSRPLEREAVLKRIPDRDGRSADQELLFVVATQTIEVGLDLDFDALVTSCAPFPALVQRFGRLDRAGDIGETDAAIVSSSEPCPVYGDATEQTWDWLSDAADEYAVDMGPHSIKELLERDPPPGPSPSLAPLLAPWHVEALSQTSLDPIPSPDVPAFLHGESALESADVRLAWRADLKVGDPHEEWLERVSLRRPHPGELLSLPLPAVRRWLRRLDPEAVADLESVNTAPHGEDGGNSLPFVRVPPPGPEGPAEPVDGEEEGPIRPGDVIVVPASYGGCDEFGWAPNSSEEVADLGNLRERRPRVLVDRSLDVPERLARAVERLAFALESDAIDDATAYEELIVETRDWLRFAAANSHYAAALRKVEGQMGDRGTAHRLAGESPGGLVLVPSAGPRSSGSGAGQSYREHVSQVEELAGFYSSAMGLDSRQVSTVRLAARYHDAGKLDRRFQAWMNGGAPGEPDKPLAKSGLAPASPRSRRQRIAAGWPEGKRHETLSCALLAAAPASALADIDRELALHLVLTHHGQNRPFLPPEEPDSEPVDVCAMIAGERVCVRSDHQLRWHEHAHRYSRLIRRFGPWGLAAIESALVLADRRASAEARP